VAAVTDSSVYTRERADRFLSYLESEWEGVPTLAEEWDELDDLDKMVFDQEWVIREDRLRDLRGWAENGLLTRNQQARYEELLKLIGEHRPMLDRLFEEEEPVQTRKAA
jgi:hypothetical protein